MVDSTILYDVAWVDSAAYAHALVLRATPLNHSW